MDDAGRLELLHNYMALEADIIQNDMEMAQLVDEDDGERRRMERRRIRPWQRNWLQRRPLHGQYERLMTELREEDLPSFRNFLRMDPQMFQELAARLGPRIEGTDTWMRRALTPELKLAITLRYLATGDSYRSLMYGFRVAHNTISVVVRQVCRAIIDEYAEEIISTPTTPAGWLQVAEGFANRWQFHHTLGALDGKHVAIRCPRNGGSTYFNYKGYHSIVLMALVDAEYKFIWVDAGANGSASDAQIWNSSELKDTIEDGTIGFPEADTLPGDDRKVPYFIIGDDAFALKPWMMKPFSQRDMTRDERVFNYRLSRARRIVENAFGILAQRFGCLLTKLQQDPHTVERIVVACVCLHNIMRLRYPALQNAALDQEDEEHNVIPGAWRDGVNLDEMHHIRGGNFTSRTAKRQRLYLKAYYNSPVGSVAWQDRMVPWSHPKGVALEWRHY